jgi:hypothetical protein
MGAGECGTLIVELLPARSSLVVKPLTSGSITLMNPPSDEHAVYGRLASPDLRDRFLTALDERDDATVRNLADYLLGCKNPLPSSTCAQLGLKAGSTYGEGAQALIAGHGRTP